MGHTERLGLAKESRILLVICAVDLVVTVWLVVTGQATEGNPVMAFYLSRGLFVLVTAKVTLTLLPIFVLEYCRRRRPRFVHGMLRVAIAAYLGIYLVAFFNVNVLALYRDPQRWSVSTPSNNQRLQHGSQPTDPCAGTSILVKPDAIVDHVD